MEQPASTLVDWVGLCRVAASELLLGCGSWQNPPTETGPEAAWESWSRLHSCQGTLSQFIRIGNSVGTHRHIVDMLEFTLDSKADELFCCKQFVYFR